MARFQVLFPDLIPGVFEWWKPEYAKVPDDSLVGIASRY